MPGHRDWPCLQSDMGILGRKILISVVAKLCSQNSLFFRLTTFHLIYVSPLVPSGTGFGSCNTRRPLPFIAVTPCLSVLCLTLVDFLAVRAQCEASFSFQMGKMGKFPQTWCFECSCIQVPWSRLAALAFNF